jgi:hypothetical protein
MATSATYNGVSWDWSEDVPVVSSIMGDPHPISASGITLTATSPAMATGSNGIQVNPTNFFNQGWDDRASNYDANLRPSLPYSASANDSIIKVRSMESGDLTPYSAGQPVNVSPANTYGNPSSTQIREAGVLTVLASDPGEPFFRPSAFGTNKTIHLVSEINQALIPNGSGSSLTAVDPSSINLAGRTLAILERRFERYQLDIQPIAAGRGTRPHYQMNSYDGFVARDIQEAIVMLSLDYTYAEKERLLHGVIQYGLDLYYQFLADDSFFTHGGRKIALMFAAYMLDNSTMKANIKKWAKEGRFYEDQRFKFRSPANLCLWGENENLAGYWQRVISTAAGAAAGPGSVPDPYGWIDGSADIGAGSYDQIHGIPKAMAHSVICRTLYPALEELWNTNTLSAGDRSEFGTWALPDPIELVSDIADAGDEDGVGRYPDRHGAAKLGSGGPYRSQFIESVFEDQRSEKALMMPVVTPYNPAAITPGSVEVSMVAFGYVPPDGWPNHRTENTPPIPADGDWPYVSEPEIRYTMDGSEPTESSTLYSTPFSVDESDATEGIVEIRAKAFKTGFMSSSTQVTRIGVSGDAFTIRQQKFAAPTGTGTTATLTLDSVPEEGNLLVLGSSWLTNQVTAAFTVPSGWTKVMEAVPPSGGFNAAGVVAWKVAGESEPTAIEVSCNFNVRRTIGVMEISGASDDPIRVTATNPSPDATPDASTSTGTTASIGEPLPSYAIAVFLGDTTSSTPVSDNHSYSNTFVEEQSAGEYGTTARAWHSMATKTIDSAGTVECTITPDQSCLVSAAIIVLEVDDTTPPALDGLPEVNAAGDELTITFSKAMNTSNTTGLSLMGFGNNAGPFTLGDPAWSEGDTVLTQSITPTVNQVQFDEFDDPINSLRLAYTAGNIEDAAGNPLANFSNQAVVNNSEQGTAFATITAQITVDGEPDLTATMPFGLFDGEITIDTSKITVSQDGDPITVTGVKQGFGLDGGGSNARIILNTDRPVYSSANGAVTITVAEGLFEDEGGNVSGPFFSEDVDNSSTQEPGPVEPPAPPAVVRRPRLTGGSAATFRVRIT